MPVDKEIVTAQLKALGNFFSLGTKKEIRFLPEILTPGETIKAVCSGLMDGNTWLCTLTDQRVLLLDKGMVAGLKQLELPISRIKSVSHKTGFLMGEVLVDTGGETKKIEHIVKADVLKFAAALSELIRARTASIMPEATPAAGGNDVVSQLERLAALKEKGILTDEEFAAQKAKILGA